jgi:regulator of CtrA degradation
MTDVLARDTGTEQIALQPSQSFSPHQTGGKLGGEMNESEEDRGSEARITPRLIDSLYTEAMILADEARAYFDEAGRDDRQALEPFARVGFACESLKVTTRIMHIVAWLLTQKAVETGEIGSVGGKRPERRLGHANDSDPLVVDQLPDSAQRLIHASADLYSRIKRLDAGQLIEEPAQSPARALMGRLERDLIWNRDR